MVMIILALFDDTDVGDNGHNNDDDGGTDDDDDDDDNLLGKWLSMFSLDLKLSRKIKF